jgi:hypothetical protein
MNRALSLLRSLSPASAGFGFILDLSWGSRPRLYDVTGYAGLEPKAIQRHRLATAGLGPKASSHVTRFG